MKRKKLFILIVIVLVLILAACRGNKNEKVIVDGVNAINGNVLDVKKVKLNEKTHKYIPNIVGDNSNEDVKVEWIIEKEDIFSDIYYSENNKELTLVDKYLSSEGSDIHLNVTLIDSNIKLTKKIRSDMDHHEVQESQEGGLWIGDDILRRLIREALGKRIDEEITYKEVEEIERFSGNNMGISSLEGLENIDILKGHWDLSNNLITDLSSLNNLVIDGSINLSGNELFDVIRERIIGPSKEVIEEFLIEVENDNRIILNELEVISGGNIVADNANRTEAERIRSVIIPEDSNLRAALLGAVETKDLYIDRNGNSYIFVEAIENLDGLDARGLNIINLNGLGNIRKLKGNWIFRQNSIGSIELNSLELVDGTLDLAYNSLSNIDDLSSLKKVTGDIMLHVNNLNNVNGLSSLKEVGESLTLSYNNLSDLSGLLFLEKAESINFAMNNSLSSTERARVIGRVNSGSLINKNGNSPTITW